MKKLICMIIAICITTVSAFAAPYRYEYIDSVQSKLASVFGTSIGYVGKTTSKTGDVQQSEAEVKPSVTDKTIANPHISDVAGSVAVVTSVSTKVVDGEAVTCVGYYANNKKTVFECYFGDDSYTDGGVFTYKDITPGSLMYVGTDKNGMVGEYCVIAVADRSTGVPRFDMQGARMAIKSSKISFESSYILNYSQKGGNCDVDLINGVSVEVPADCNQYTVEQKNRSVTVHSGDCTKGSVYTAEYDETTDKTAVYPFFAVIYDGEAVFACSYSTCVYIDGDITD